MKPEYRKKQILTAAKKVFAAKGYHNTNIELICTKSGAARGTIYRYFKNKEGIFAAILEESLAEFAGALVLVSHDRYLLDRVCDRVLGFTGEGEVRYFADYRQWLAALKEKTNNDQVVASTESHKKVSPKGKGGAGVKAGRLSYLDQREYDQLEGKIEEAETLQARLEEELANPDSAAEPTKLEECWQKLEAVKQEVEALYDRWQELEEKKQAS